MATSFLSWLECIMLRGVDMARTLSEERLMRERCIWRLTIKSAVSLDVMREGFSAAKALPRQAGNGYDWLIGAVVIVTKLSYVVVWCMDYVSDDHSITPYSGHILWTVLLPFHRGHGTNFVSDHMRVRWIWLLRSWEVSPLGCSGWEGSSLGLECIVWWSVVHGVIRGVDNRWMVTPTHFLVWNHE